MARGQTVTLEIENLPAFIADLERMEERADRAMSVALVDEADQIMDRADILVPVDDGELKRSRFVGLVHRWLRGLEIKFGYGSPYALYQHYAYWEHDDGRRLFLEQPVRYSRRGLADRLKSTLVRYLR